MPTEKAAPPSERSVRRSYTEFLRRIRTEPGEWFSRPLEEICATDPQPQPSD
jgi:hypothetical protein